MWGRHKDNVNTVAFYKKLVAKKNDTLGTDARQIFDFFLNQMFTFGYSPEIFNYTAVDKRSRLAFVNRYPSMLFKPVYDSRINTLTKNSGDLERAFENQMKRQKRLAERQGRFPENLAACRRKCLEIQSVCFAVAASIALMMVMAFSITHSDDTSLEKARLHSARINAAISFGVIVAFGALVLGLLQYSILRTRPYKQSQIKAFLSETEELRSSLPGVLPESQEEWETAFDKLVVLEDRVGKKLDHLKRLSNRDVEAQPEMGERVSLVRNRF